MTYVQIDNLTLICVIAYIVLLSVLGLFYLLCRKSIQLWGIDVIILLNVIILAGIGIIQLLLPLPLFNIDAASGYKTNLDLTPIAQRNLEESGATVDPGSFAIRDAATGSDFLLLLVTSTESGTEQANLLYYDRNWLGNLRFAHSSILDASRSEASIPCDSVGRISNYAVFVGHGTTADSELYAHGIRMMLKPQSGEWNLYVMLVDRPWIKSILTLAAYLLSGFVAVRFRAERRTRYHWKRGDPILRILKQETITNNGDDKNE